MVCSSRFFLVDQGAGADIPVIFLSPGLAISKVHAQHPRSWAAACSLPGAGWEGWAEGLSGAKGSRPPPRARVRVPRGVTTCLPSPLSSMGNQRRGRGAGRGWLVQ